MKRPDYVDTAASKVRKEPEPSEEELSFARGCYYLAVSGAAWWLIWRGFVWMVER
jgi:hypothetical protein